MTNELYHHGILGQKWGVRRFQNPDGTLTKKGAERIQMRKTERLNELKKRADKAEADKKYYKKELENVRKEGVKSDEVQRMYSVLDDEEKKLIAEARAERIGDMDYYIAKSIGMPNKALIDKLVLDDLLETSIPALEESYASSVKSGKEYAERYSKLEATDVDRMAQDIGFRKAYRRTAWA